MDRAAGLSIKLNKRYLQNPYQAGNTALPGCVPAEPDPGIGRARGRFRDRNSGAMGRSQGALCSNRSQKKSHTSKPDLFGPHPGTSPPRHGIAASAVDHGTGKRRMDRAADRKHQATKTALQNPYHADHTALPGCVPAEPDPGIGRARGRFRDRNSEVTGRCQGAHCSNKSQKKPQIKTGPFRTASQDIAAPSWDRRASGRSCDGKAAHGLGRGPERQAEQTVLTKPIPDR